MATRTEVSVAAMLWATAFVAMALASLLAPAVAEDIVCLVALGHGLTAVAVAADPSARRQGGAPPGRRVTVAVLALAAAGEVLGVLESVNRGPSALALWFGVGLSFAATGIVVSWRRIPPDRVFASQLYFHLAMMLPLLLAATETVADLAVGTSRQGGMRTIALGWSMLLVATVAMPLLFTTLVVVLLSQRSRRAEDRDRAWVVLLVHQAAVVVLLTRWAAEQF